MNKPVTAMILQFCFLFLCKIKQMRIDIITVLPELIESPLNHSIIRRAVDRGLVTINLVHLRDFATDRHKSVDDYAFGGGAGMVMTVEPIYNAINSLTSERSYDEIIYVSPDGENYSQQVANELSLMENIIILAGHYKGVDQRVRDHLVTREISIGDFVLSGGELPSVIIADSIVRLLPGALGDEQSALNDSFQDGLLAPPVYSRPADFKGWKVPEILLSGNTGEIEKWRFEKSLERTRNLRPGLLDDEDE
jgi:tRNA (guanine37-N1)-methyltransferase